MNCSFPIAQLQKYCTAELTPQERLSVKQHIVDCPTCQDRYNALVDDLVNGRGPSRPAVETRQATVRQDNRKPAGPPQSVKPARVRLRLRMPAWSRHAMAPAILALSFAFVVAVFVAVGTGAYDLASPSDQLAETGVAMVPTATRAAAAPEETRATAAPPAPRPATPAPTVTPAVPTRPAAAMSKPLQADAHPAKAKLAIRPLRPTARPVVSLSFVQPIPVPVPPAVIEAPAPAPLLAAVREPAPKVALIHGIGSEPLVVPVARPLRPEDFVERIQSRVRPSVRAVVIYGVGSEPLVVPVGGSEPDRLVIAGF
ncbi:MAG: anti-sigma factor family protein [Bryobacteraceae bacterium]